MPNKIKVILVDDEKHSREIMSNLLANYFPTDVIVIGEAANANEAFELINISKPDLVFLDIQMPRADGFSLLKRFETIPFEIIFATSFDHYAITAIKFSALDYLLKPIEIKDLQFAVNKAIESIGKKKSISAQIANLLNGLKADEKEKKVAVHFRDGVKLLKQTDIIYIEAEGRYCRIYLQNSEHYVITKYLKDFEFYFGSLSTFARINKSYLINTNYIQEYSKGEPCIIKLQNGQAFEVSRRKKQEILDLIKK